MRELPPLPDWKAIEAKCSRRWRRWRVYEFKANEQPPFVIDTPPPFTSGALHMGHALSYSYIDFTARFKRMTGYNVYYPQGWDCQGFPTELKVEQAHGRLPRAAFLKHCRAYSEANIRAMRRQMRALGLSPDWRYEYRTMSRTYHAAVQRSLLEMHEKGLIYRTRAPVLWCTRCRSAIAKAELEEIERTTHLHYIAFALQSAAKHAEGEGVAEALVATTRPELLHACVALAVNPGDERWRALIGRRATTPIFTHSVPIISDPDVDQAFGSGIVMICTFGDKLDVLWVARHNLQIIEAMNEEGKLLNAGPYTGLDISIARQRIIQDLEASGSLRRSEPILQRVRVHDRCGHATEWLLSHQWFARVKEQREAVIEAARSMRWHPEWVITYLIDWAQALEWDWCISRQRVFGTPLPFWLCTKCGAITTPPLNNLPVDPAREPPPRKTCKCGGRLVGETSTCDCWIDSSITPLVIAQLLPTPMNAQLYPATLRPQGLEIIRTWAFYTIYRCLALTGRAPFSEVLINGTVLGTDGRKMSKSLGNYEDPDVLLAKYASDALRQWAALSGALARDRAFNYRDVERGQAFLIKLWNAARFTQHALRGYRRGARHRLRAVDAALLSKLQRLIQVVTASMQAYNYYDAINAIHAFVWSDLCAHYLEQIKHRLRNASPLERRGAQHTLAHTLLTLLKLLAPITPFVAEELYQRLFANAREARSIHLTRWPSVDESLLNPRAEELWRLLRTILDEVKKFKTQRKLSLGTPLTSLEVAAPEEVLRELSAIEEEIKAVARAPTIILKAGAELVVQPML